jgi:hypothetical protein
MTVTLYSLNRHRDLSGISGEGDDIATICEFPSGLVAMHWNSDTPTVTVLTDLRHVTQLHAHGGASTLEILEPRLVTAYKRVTPFLLEPATSWRVRTCAPHPDHPDRLRLTFPHERAWRFWIALLDGSTDAATHAEVNGEIEHRWISADGNLWLQWHSPLTNDKEDRLTAFDREDR